jgi:hypothetical protein
VAKTGQVEPNTRSVSSLCHYTNLAGLIGILENQQLWASNVAFLNDREELLHGVKCAKRALNQILKDRKLIQWRDAIRTVVNEIEEGRLPNTYATCFCEKSDLLSQWRGYGGAEQGVCLVFERSGLEALRAGKQSFLTPVQYGLISGKMQLREGLRERLLSIAAEELTAMNEDDKREEVYEVLSELIPRFKHKGFEAELEWRLVVQHKTLRDSVCFRPNRNVLVPYIKLDSRGSLPLKYVRIGPGHDTKLTQRSVEQFLEAKGYAVPVSPSKVPSRL